MVKKPLMWLTYMEKNLQLGKNSHVWSNTFLCAGSFSLLQTSVRVEETGDFFVIYSFDIYDWSLLFLRKAFTLLCDVYNIFII